MIKNIFIAGLMCLFSTSVFAQQIAIDFNKNKDQDQVSPKVREKMDEFQIQIKSIVNEEKLKLDQGIQKIDQDLAEGKISKTQADDLKLELAENSSEIINDRIQKVNFDLDDLIKKQVAFSILNGNDSGVIPEKPKSVTVVSTNQLSAYVAYGVMGFSGTKDEMLDNHLGFMNNTEIGAIYEKQLGVNSPFSFKSGLVFSWRTIRLEDNYKFDRTDNGSTTLTLSDVNLDKSKLRGTYIMIPVGLDYTFMRKVVNNNVEVKKISPYTLGFNFYGGAKISNNNIIKGNGVKARDKKDYNLNPFIYGAQVTFTYNNWSLYARKDFSNYFDKNTFDNSKMFQVGLAYGL